MVNDIPPVPAYLSKVFAQTRIGIQLDRKEDVRKLLEACLQACENIHNATDDLPPTQALNTILSAPTGENPEVKIHFIKTQLIFSFSYSNKHKNGVDIIVFSETKEGGVLSLWTIRGNTILTINKQTKAITENAQYKHVKITINGIPYDSLTSLIDAYDCGLQKMLLLLMDADFIVTKKDGESVTSNFTFLEGHEKYLEIAKDTPVDVFSEMLSYNKEILAPVSEHTLEGFTEAETPVTGPDIVATLFRNNYLN